MIVGVDPRRPATLEELIEPALAARLDRLDLLSRKILAGKLPGERRSKRRGRSVEFDDFRTYVPGDDPRHIDWNVYARLDRLFIKLFREDEDLSVQIAVDASPSMDAGVPGKLVFAHRLAMALAYVALVNQNRVEVTSFGGPRAPGGGDAAALATSPIRRLAPVRGRASMNRVAGFLLESLARRHEPGQPVPTIDESLRSIAMTRRARGVTIVISDFLEPGGCAAGLAYLAGPPNSYAPGHDAYAIQVLSPGELDPAREPGERLTGDLRLFAVENPAAGADVTTNPVVFARYRRAVGDFIDRFRRDCTSRGIAHFLVPSDSALDRLVLDTLRRGGMLR